MTKSTLCLWYQSGAQDAARFYAEHLPETEVLGLEHAPGDNPSTAEGAILFARLNLVGFPAILLNGGPHFALNEAASLQIHTDDQAETDRLWTALTSNGGAESRCGWCKDRWGLSWQITPRALTEGMADPDPATRKRVFEAMMTMGKIDIAAIEAARSGEA